MAMNPLGRCVSPLLILITACATSASPTPLVTTRPVPPAPRPPAAGVTFLGTAPPGALALDVAVTPWSCAITDSNGVFDEELHFPLGRAIRLNLHDDDPAENVDVQIEGKVIHVAHGSAEQVVFRADRQGEYTWRCPVRKGPNVRMDIAMPLFAHSPSDYVDYQRRQDEQTRPTTREGKIALGKKTYEKKGCNACHTDDGSPRIGASFAGLWGHNVTLADGSVRTVDEQFVKDALVNPRVVRQPGYRDVMPNFECNLRPEEITALASYIESLRGAE